MEIIINEGTYKHYKKVCGEFGERLESNLTLYEDGEPGFVLQNDNCPFLNKNNLSDIYTELGKESLCYTCKTYLRFIEEYSDLREMGISLSCLETARLILQDSKPVTFEISEAYEMVNTYDDINFYISVQLISARKTAIGILQNRSIDLNYGIALVINFAHDIQEEINENKLSKITDIINKYSKEPITSSLMNLISIKQSKLISMIICLNV